MEKKELEINKIYKNAKKLNANLGIGLNTILSEDNKEFLDMSNDKFRIGLEKYFNITCDILEAVENNTEHGFSEPFTENDVRSVYNFLGIPVNDKTITNILSSQDSEQSNLIRMILNRGSEIIMIKPDYSKNIKVNMPLNHKSVESNVQVSNEIMNKLPFIMDANNEFEGLIDEQSLYKRMFRTSMMVNPISNERKLNLIEKPFYDEKFIPTEQEFKVEAKSIKNNYPNLGTAQNELAKIYGFKDYRAIKPCFTSSNDEIGMIIVNTYKLNDNEYTELNNLFWKFRIIFRCLNIGVGLLNQFNAFENVHPRLYCKDTKKLLIQENSLMQIYSYFLTENSILFGQIKRNIQKLSQDEKTNILKDLESLEIDKKDETVFGLFVGLLEYHIGKSAGDVTLVEQLTNVGEL